MENDPTYGGPLDLIQLRDMGLNYVIMVTPPSFMPFKVIHLVGMENEPTQDDYDRVERAIKTDIKLSHLWHLRPELDYVMFGASINEMLADIGWN